MHYKKQFGQHFLTSEICINKIISIVPPELPVIEVGPGNGALTVPMLELGLKVTAIEIDKDMEPQLLLLKSKYSNFNYLIADALQVNVNDIYKSQKYSIVSNLPYNVGTKLYLNWLYKGVNIEKMVLMFQKDVALRINAKVNTRDYGRLSVISNLLADISLELELKQEDFFPPPKVESAVISVKPLESMRYACDINTINNITNIAFQQRRKTINNSLKQFKLNFDNLNINPIYRPENITTKEFSVIANYIDQYQDQY